jgi:geranylgeranyl pyrophosphate synthase
VDVLDDVADGDEPDCGRQAPNLALALLGESIGLLGGLPPPLAGRLQRLWSAAWTRCAAAQARDVALTGLAAPTVEDALAVAEGSGLLTRWAVEAGALLAGAPPALVAPLALFGQHLGTAEKLLHDLHDVWPSSQRSDDLARPSCNLALIAARQMGLLPAAGHLGDETALRERLLGAGVLHYAWAHADRYRLAAAAALEDFAGAGGDAASLWPILALSPDLRVVQGDDAEL